MTIQTDLEAGLSGHLWNYDTGRLDDAEGDDADAEPALGAADADNQVSAWADAPSYAAEDLEDDEDSGCADLDGLREQYGTA